MNRACEELRYGRRSRASLRTFLAETSTFMIISLRLHALLTHNDVPGTEDFLEQSRRLIRDSLIPPAETK